MANSRRGAGGGAAAFSGAVLFVCAALVGEAGAGANRCTYNGRTYEEGVVIRQAGLRQLCMNGEWQDQGRFCPRDADGAPIGVPFIGPGQVDIQVPPAAED